MMPHLKTAASMWPVVMVADRPTSSFNLPRRRWLRFSLAGLLFFVFCWAGLLAGFRVASQRVVLNPDPMRLTIPQRSSQAIPGLQGRAHVRLSDITRGRAVLSIDDNGPTTLLSSVTVRDGDVLPFTLDGQQFYLHVIELKNALIGDDSAFIEISTVDRWTVK